MLAIVFGLCVAGGVLFLLKEPWDSRLGAARTAHALQVRLHTTVSYSCRVADNDGTISLSDVDYFCEPVGHHELPGYWVGTNEHRITEIQPTG